MDRTSWLFYVRRIDGWMVCTVLALMTLGVLFIYSASWAGEDLPMPDFYRKQVVWCAVGWVCFFVLLRIDYRDLAGMSWLLYALGIALLVLVLLVSEPIHGSRRWLNFLGFQAQPSEFAKLATVIALARYLARPGRNMGEYKVIWMTGLILAVPFLLIYVEPDLGTAAVLLPAGFVLLFVAGVPWRRLAALVLVGVMMLPAAWFFALGEYQKERVRVFLDPGRDPLGAGWNKIQSEIAVGSGGLTGKGYLEGTQNVLGFLPRSVAPTDFIYSVVAEETGFVGSALVLSLYAGVLLGIGRAALASRDQLGRLLASGLATMLFCHIAVNIAMTIGLMPITGLPLPLMSYGGSFMISTLCGLGLSESVFVRRIQP